MRISPSVFVSDTYDIVLPISKSIRARELILDALNNKRIEVQRDNDDLYVLSSALSVIQEGAVSDIVVLDLHHSGTAMRFLTAFCAVSPGKYILQGSDRLSDRPISGLVDSLLRIGAHIKYKNRKGHLPLLIEGADLCGCIVDIDAGISSQFVSALMLISSKIDGGCYINLQGKIVSKKYIDLTESVINKYYKEGIRNSGEKDWSSATVWYSFMAVSRCGRLRFPDLDVNSKQPDREIIDIYHKLGVNTYYTEYGVEISPSDLHIDELNVDCLDIPDSVVYIVVVACLLNIKFRISGIKTLKYKESDRINSLISELRKVGCFIDFIEPDFLVWNGKTGESDRDIVIDVHDDHRIAMAMSLIGLKKSVRLNNPDVIEKSYPAFWNEYGKFVNIE